MAAPFLCYDLFQSPIRLATKLQIRTVSSILTGPLLSLAVLSHQHKRSYSNMRRARGRSRGGNRSANQQRRGALTHFLCLPLVTRSSRPQIEASLVRFQALVAELNRNAPAPAVVPLSAIRPVDTIHLTLGVMRLKSPEKVEEVVEFLTSLDASKILSEVQNSTQSESQERSVPALQVSLKSLSTMHKATDTSVLYASAEDSSDRIDAFCEALRKAFIEKGYIDDENRPLKLHATVINTIYAKKELGVSKSLDATELLARFEDFQWTDAFRVEKIAICEMGAKKTYDENGVVISEAYKEIASVELPG